MGNVRTGVLILLAVSAGLAAEVLRAHTGRRRIARSWAAAADRL